MALKPVYVIDGRRWLPLARAARLLATNGAGVKRLIAEGMVEWCQRRAGSTTLLVAEADVLRLRLARDVGRREVRARDRSAAATVDQRGRSMRLVAPASARSLPPRGPGVFERSWDPAPLVSPVAGREPDAG